MYIFLRILEYILDHIYSEEYCNIYSSEYAHIKRHEVQPRTFTPIKIQGIYLYSPYGLYVSIPAMMIPHLLIVGNNIRSI
jgi:hypothetical protein